jgi:hypothetical protein
MIAQLVFEAFCLSRGWDAFRPVREDSDCDILLCTRGVEMPPARVQVKRVYYDRTGHRTINLRRRDGSRYRAKQVDYIAAVEVSSRTIWLIPFDVPGLWNVKLAKPKGRLRLTDAWKGYIQK